jgi:hypothetical protein
MTPEREREERRVTTTMAMVREKEVRMMTPEREEEETLERAMTTMTSYYAWARETTKKLTMMTPKRGSKGGERRLWKGQEG